MKELDFDLAKRSKNLAEEDHQRAQKVLRKHERYIWEHAEVTGLQTGSNNGVPFILVLTRPGTTRELVAKIPDELDGLEVYFSETDYEYF